jgi:hypothetical protein
MRQLDVHHSCFRVYPSILLSILWWLAFWRQWYKIKRYIHDDAVDFHGLVARKEQSSLAAPPWLAALRINHIDPQEYFYGSTRDCKLS